MTEEERVDYCYECTAYGDDYYYDDNIDEYVKACDKCWVNEQKDE